MGYTLLTNRMRSLFLLSAIILTILGCSDETVKSRTEIVGQWKLISSHPSPWSSYIGDHSDENIVYDFKSNETLTVSGNGHPAPHPDGQYDYFFGEGSVSGTQKVLLVKIDDDKWTYDFHDGRMVLSQTYVDGPALTFVRK